MDEENSVGSNRKLGDSIDSVRERSSLAPQAGRVLNRDHAHSTENSSRRIADRSVQPGSIHLGLQ